MGDQAVKLQLFRFIDVLPLLRSPDEIVRHLREYFQEAAQHLPRLVRWGLRWLPDTSLKRKRRTFFASASGLCSRLLAYLAQSNAERLARRFIAGSNLEEALLTVAKLRKRRLTFTVDLLGEATITEAEAQRNEETYLHIIEGLSQEVNAWPAVDLVDRDHLGPLPRVNVSIKLSSLYSQFDPLDRGGTTTAVCARLRPILRAAQKHRAFVNFDMEQYRLQGRDAARLSHRSPGARVPRLARRRHRHPGLSAPLRTRPGRVGRLGSAAGHAGLGSAHQGSVLGLRDRPGRSGRLARTRFRAQMADGRQLRAADSLFAGESRRCCGRRWAATTSAAWPTPWPPPTCWVCRRGVSSSRCSTAWASRFKTPSSI